MQINNSTTNVPNKGNYYAQSTFTYQGPIQDSQTLMQEVQNSAITQIAQDMVKEDVKKSKTAKLLKALPGIAIGTLIGISALKTPGQISNKLNSALKSAGYFAGGAIILRGMNKIYKKIDKKNAQKGKEVKNPTAKALGRFVIDMGVLIGAFMGIQKGAKFINRSFPQINEAITKNTKKVNEWINKSGLEKINKNIQGKYAKFAEKHPTITKNVSKNATLMTIAGYLLADIGLSSKLQEEKQKSAEEYVKVLQQQLS